MKNDFIFKIFVVVFFLSSSTILAQVNFVLLENRVLKYESPRSLTLDSKSVKHLFGGISGIEFIQRDSSFILISDKDGSQPKTDFSYVFPTLNPLSNGFDISYKFHNVKNVESIRWNTKMNKFFYAFEEDKRTGFGYIDDNKRPHELFLDTLHIDNRGFEGLTFDKNNNLWIANESGKVTTPNPDGKINFYRFSLNDLGTGYDTTTKKIFTYPFDNCSCGTSQVDRNLGNGVSEILAYPDDVSKMLVLERCYDGKIAYVKLFMATIDTSNNSITKTEVFDFNKQGSNNTPDNLESMTWGLSEGGLRVLYLASDDNFNASQKTQILKLREK